MRFFSFLLLCTAPVLADVPPPNTDTCRGQQVGAACTLDQGGAGTCATSICTRLDYSNGVPPTPKTYECLMCTTSSPVPVEPVDAGPAPKTPSRACSVAPAWGAVAMLLLRRKR